MERGVWTWLSPGMGSCRLLARSVTCCYEPCWLWFFSWSLRQSELSCACLDEMQCVAQINQTRWAVGLSAKTETKTTLGNRTSSDQKNGYIFGSSFFRTARIFNRATTIIRAKKPSSGSGIFAWACSDASVHVFWICLALSIVVSSCICGWQVMHDSPVVIRSHHLLIWSRSTLAIQVDRPLISRSYLTSAHQVIWT